MNSILRALLFFFVVTAAGFAQSAPDFAATKKKAEAGDAEAQVRLGTIYDQGHGVTKDSAEAVRWFRKAADQGHARGQFILGGMYGNGTGVSKDLAEAAKWYRKAADQGYAVAQFNLGVMYVMGNGVPKDLVQAHAWWNIAGASGHADAKTNLAIVEKEMTDTQKEKAMDLARELFAKLPKGK